MDNEKFFPATMKFLRLTAFTQYRKLQVSSEYEHIITFVLFFDFSHKVHWFKWKEKLEKIIEEKAIEIKRMLHNT